MADNPRTKKKSVWRLLLDYGKASHATVNIYLDPYQKKVFLACLRGGLMVEQEYEEKELPDTTYDLLIEIRRLMLVLDQKEKRERW